MSLLQSRRWAEEGGGQGGSREEGGGREALAATPNDDDAGCHNCETLNSRWSMIYLIHVDFGFITVCLENSYWKEFKEFTGPVFDTTQTS